MKIKIKKYWEVIALILMTAYDASLHWVETLGIYQYHPLYPMFPLIGISYDIFWTTYWTIAFLLTIKILIKLRRKNNANIRKT